MIVDGVGVRVVGWGLGPLVDGFTLMLDCLLLDDWDSLAFPTDPRRFHHDLILESGQFGINIRQVQPRDVILVQHLKSEDVLPCNWEILMQMLESDIVLLDVDSKDVRHLWVVLVFRDVVVDEGHLFFHFF